MADDTEDQQRIEGDLHPVLQDFTNAFTQDESRSWAKDAAVRVQDWMQRKQIADANQQAGQNLVDNIASFKNELVGLAGSDPSAVHLALDLVPGTIGHLVANNPNHPEDQKEATHAALTGHIQNEIARAAVQKLAEHSDIAARDLLGEDRISGLFGADEHAALNSYIDMQSLARNADEAAQRQRLTQEGLIASEAAAHAHASGLYDPQRDDVNFPPGWASRLMADTTVPPPAKASLMDLYGRLQADGDAPQSDPHLVAGLLDRIANGAPPTQADILGHAGDRLKMADALSLAKATFPLSPEARGPFVRLNELVQQGKNTIGAPENGPAGQNAFARYVNWLMPAIRNGGASLDPAEPAYAGGRLPQFAPTGKDTVQASVTPPENRPSLDDIFGKRRG